MFESQYFRIEPVQEGVYALIAADEVWSLGNAGIVDLGQETLVFDTFSSPQAAEDLKKAAEQLTSHPVTWVVNSHWHGDHHMGNQVFCPGARIVSTPGTRQFIEKNAETLAVSRQRLPAGIRFVQERAAGEPSAEIRQRLLKRAAVMETQLVILNAYQMTLPQVTFETEMSLHGARRSAVLLSYGAGHTESDACLWLPQEKILFTGDLLVYREHPWMGDSRLDLWPATLKQMAALQPDVLVPGHGSPTGVEAIAPMLGYLDEIGGLAREAACSGKSKEEAQAAPMPEAYRSWAGGEGYARNLQALYERFKQN